MKFEKPVEVKATSPTVLSGELMAHTHKLLSALMCPRKVHNNRLEKVRLISLFGSWESEKHNRLSV